MESAHNLSLKLAVNRIEVSRYADAVDPAVVHFNSVHAPTGTRGIGTDVHSRLALLKSISELLERRALQDSLAPDVSTSSGFAAHLNPEKAKAAAVLELYERDAFLLGWLMKRPPAWLTEEMISSEPGLADRLSAFKLRGFDARLGILAVTGQQTVTAVAALRPGGGDRADFGLGLATSCGSSFSAAFNGALLELHRIATLVMNRRAMGLACYEEVGAFKEAEEDSEAIDPVDHLEFYLNPEAAASASWYWKGCDEVLLLDAPPVEVEIVEESRLLGPRFVIARARSEKLQAYYCGATTDSKVNWDRLRQYHQGAIHRAPHPLG